jgi:hypothetical protein
MQDALFWLGLTTSILLYLLRASKDVKADVIRDTRQNVSSGNLGNKKGTILAILAIVPNCPFFCPQCWGHLGTFGDIWGQMGTNGDIWGHLGTNGDKWGQMGTFGDIWRKNWGHLAEE